MDTHAVPTWPALLGTLAAGGDLTAGQASWAMEQVLSGEAAASQFGALVLGLRAKGETAVEVGALVETMIAHARLLDFRADGDPLTLDVVGTGGDQAHTVNISTMAALVCAASGVLVVKHGNRAASSTTGTADVLQALGLEIELEPEQVVACVREVGIGFCFAPLHHPALRHAAPWRRELGIPTVLNILGPLANPGLARSALVGTANAGLGPVMASVLHRRGVRALVVRGEDGLDEISLSGPTAVWDATGPQVVATRIDATDLGFPRTPIDLLRGGSSGRNADLLRAALAPGSPQGPDAEQVGAIRDAVLVNAAAALVAYRAARQAESGGEPSGTPLVERIAREIPVARAVLADGSALDLLHAWAQATHRVSAVAVS